MSRKIIEAKELTFSYEEDNPALQGVSVIIYEREKIAVLGANGAGKSTFFLNLNGVRKPDAGELFLYGEKIGKKNRKELTRNVGIVFQDADSQIIGSTVKAEVAFGPLNKKLPRKEVEKWTVGAIKRMDLEEYVERPPHYLSEGEKKRVSIADILAMNYPLVIFDEPTASLDPVNAEALEKVLGDLEGEGKTVMLSTHDVDFAYRFADRILVFWKGKVIADGKPEEVFQIEEVLEKANLKKPMIMQVYGILKKKGLLQEGGSRYPRTLAEIESLL